MIQAKQIHAKKPEQNEGLSSWFEIQLIHPLTEEIVLEADGFPTLDDVASFVSDLGSAITDIIHDPSDLKEQIRIISE